MKFNIDIKKPIVIGAIKLGLTHTEEGVARAEDDDAYLEIGIKLKWDVGNELYDLATIKLDKYEAKDTSVEDLDKSLKLVRCKDDISYCGK